MQCTAKSKRSGKQCGNHAVKGRKTCRMHGGKQKRGVEHHLFKTGAYSKAAPQYLKQRYEEALASEELMTVHNEVALVRARIMELLERSGGASTDAWEELNDSYKRIRDYNSRQQWQDAANELHNLGDIIQAAQADLATWKEIRTLIEEHRRLVESERRHTVQMGAVITLQEGMVLMANVLDILTRHVTDKGVLSAVGRDLEKTLAISSSNTDAISG